MALKLRRKSSSSKKELKRIGEGVVVDSVLLLQAQSDLLKMPSGCVNDTVVRHTRKKKEIQTLIRIIINAEITFTSFPSVWHSSSFYV